jgi:hypothetical protein
MAMTLYEALSRLDVSSELANAGDVPALSASAIAPRWRPWLTHLWPGQP